MRVLIRLLVLMGLFSTVSAAGAMDTLEAGFRQPSPDARPWVYWFWLNGNITPAGITADLEAMKRVGIGGVLIMEVDQGAPVGPVDFMASKWRDLFRHVHAEAQRLGLEVNMNNDAGWNGSGGPWIKPEQSMQEVVWTETEISGTKKFNGKLVQPKAVAGYYRDIAVLAFKSTGDYRIPNIESKAAFQRRGIHKPSKGDLSAQTTIPQDGVVNLTEKMDSSGRLEWETPEGDWTVIRFGHTCTGVENAPAPKTGRGLECDKLSRRGIEANFNAMMAKLADDTGLEPGKTRVGLVATHIDSWENGSQNWTGEMPEEFRNRRGYDLLPFMPVLTGRVVCSAEVSERFLWDVRQTVSEMVIENYAGRMKELAHSKGMRFTVEAYGSPCDAIPYGGQADEPMGEFWTPGGGAIETCRGMASTGHVYGKRIIGAEAFTSADQERWLEHPAILKSHGDRAFCEGINRFVFHRYAMQPWTDNRVPGMTMGPWGQHYERTQTWWEWTPKWHEYLARCQFMLRQGLFVADICRLQAEAPPQGFGYFDRLGYDWDECGADIVLNRMSVKNGRIVLSEGMSYRLLVLPQTKTMTPRLLRKIKDLVERGATIIGPRPEKSPSLSGYPKCDAEVERMGAELWGDCDGNRVKERKFGRGRVIWGIEPEQILQRDGFPQDFTSDQPLRFIHRSTGKAEIYFLANLKPASFTAVCSFRVSGKVPELWWPDSGRLEQATVWGGNQGAVTRVSIPFEPSGSVFVVFRRAVDNSDAIVLVKRDGKEVLTAMPEPPVKIAIRKALYGVLDDPDRTRDVTAKVQRRVDAGEFSFIVSKMAEGDDPAFGIIKTLAVEYTVDDKDFFVKAFDPDSIVFSRQAARVTIEKAIYGVIDDPKRTRNVREKLQRLVDSGQTSFKVAMMAQGDDPAHLVVKTLEIDYMMNGQRRHLTGQDPDTLSFTPESFSLKSLARVRKSQDGRMELETGESGDYEWSLGSGKTGRASVKAIQPSMEMTGSWQVRFEPGRGASQETIFDELISWSEHGDPGIKYFSGEATYTRTISLPAEFQKQNQRLYLDLGKVAIMAQVKLNGKECGILWKSPFVVDITDTAKAGANELEVRVVNLWPNRLIGDEQLAEDSERNPDGTLKTWPQWLLEGKSSPAGRFTFTSWRLWKKEEKPLESGLLGPIMLRTTQVIPMETP